MTVVCYLVGDHTPRDVSSIDEMDLLLDLTALQSDSDMGCAVDFWTDDDLSRLVVGVGRDLVPVYHDDDRPESDVISYMRSQGAITGAEGEKTEIWRIGTSWDEVPRDMLIPESDAREAAREWFRTGNRPTNVRWQV